MNLHRIATAIIAGAVCAAPAFAANATKDEAVAMVKKGVALIKTSGKDKTFAEVSNKSGAHGANEKMIGKNLIELKDVDGKPFIKERMELAQAKPSFWQEYKFTNPVSKKVEPKQMYCERADDVVVCGGVYK